MKFLLKISFSVILSAAVCAKAQTTADSTFLYQQANLNFQSLKWGITQLHNTELNKASSFGLNYNYQSGSFRQAQQAEKTTNASLTSEGISTIDRFKLYGYFSFSKTWQDSLKLSQKGIEDAYTPYYFIAGKAGTFERQKYLGGGLVSYELLKEKLYLGTGVDYLYNSSARSVDPRSLVTTYKIVFSPELAFRFKQNTVGLGIIAGYGDEKVEVGYVNSNFGGSLLYPDRISYLNYGYGYIQINTTNFIRRNTYTGLKLNYAGKFNNWEIRGRLNYLVSKEVNQIVKEMALNDETFGTFQLETYKADIILNKKVGQINHQLSIQASKNTGDDNLVSLKARNYTLNSSEINLNYAHLKSNAGTKNIEWFINANLKDFYQRDAAANHTLKYSYIKTNIGSTIYWKVLNKDLLTTEITAGSRLPLNSDLVVPGTQVNIFTRGVAYPDYLYWSSTMGELQFLANYTTNKLLNKFRTGITFKSSYFRNLGTPASNLDATFIPGKSYLDINLSLNLYF
ncbi:DUF6850 family outer membrane beta-barrel protein [Pedobacter aquatilis]|uniref:DUF6850 family outer membrane beta-barrel protein n=1 Tax=Pedobacter aquatilis TaxID=351343 RepID=UPI00292FB465|nr:DUF6850 family outer membrane beta-barrel protein [Pedobacter aquatilis]